MTTSELTKKDGPETTDTPEKKPLAELVFGYAQPSDESARPVPVTGEELHNLSITWATFQVLTQYQEFKGNSKLMAFLKSVPELKPFLSRMPETESAQDRISQILPWLKTCKRTDKADVLEAVIRTLYERGTTEEKPDTLVICAHCGRAHPWGQQICESCPAPIKYQKDYYVFHP